MKTIKDVWEDLEWKCSGCGNLHTRAFINVFKRAGDDISVVRNGNKVTIVRYA